MKIRFFSDYAGSAELTKRFIDNYCAYDSYLEFTNDYDYQFAVVFNSTEEWLLPDAKVITVVQEPSWSEAHSDNSFLLNSDIVILHDSDLFQRTRKITLGGKILELPSYMFYDDRVPRGFYDTIYPQHKTKKISMIVSALAFKHGNYRKRLKLLRTIVDSDLEIDIYGRGFNISDSRYKGEVQFKHMALVPYEYSIAIENCSEKNYITEKFVDCVLCNTIPIYNGAPNIEQVYDKRYFEVINLDSSHIIDDLKEIISAKAPFSNINKEIYYNNHNLYTKLQIIYGG